MSNVSLPDVLQNEYEPFDCPLPRTSCAKNTHPNGSATIASASSESLPYGVFAYITSYGGLFNYFDGVQICVDRQILSRVIIHIVFSVASISVNCCDNDLPFFFCRDARYLYSNGL